MEHNHKLALYVCYYLSRFNKSAYEKLNLGNQTQTHIKIGEILSVKPSSVKNWRDEFDPLFGHRVGWYQRPISPSRAQVVNALSEMSESEVYSLVVMILNNKKGNFYSELNILKELVNESFNDKANRFILRTPTGKKAEEFYIDYFEYNKKPMDGKLIDTRDLGCGYDFEIINAKNKYYVEIKGITKLEGGILFTNKEWETAKKHKENYFLAVISNLENDPQIKFIRNPVKHLSPRESIVKTIQVNWSISTLQLKEFYERPK